MTHGALDLFVTGMTDEQDVDVIARESLRLAVHLRDEGTGGVDRVEPAIGGALHHRGRNAMGGKNDVRALGYLADLVDEDRALLFEGRDHVDVMHDLLAHVHR